MSIAPLGKPGASNAWLLLALKALAIQPSSLHPVGNHALARHHVYAFCHRGGEYILKLYYLPRRASTEAYACALVRAAGLPAPRILYGGALPGGVDFVLMNRLPGHPAAAQPQPPALYHVMGEALARLHSENPRPPAPNHAAHLSTRAEKHMQRIYAANLPARDTAVFAKALALQTTLLRTVDFATLPFCLCHGDYDERNVLVDEGRLTGIIDLEMATAGPTAQDMALLYRKTLYPPQHAVLRTAFEAGYARYAPFPTHLDLLLPLYWIDGCLDAGSWAYGRARAYYDQSLAFLKTNVL